MKLYHPVGIDLGTTLSSAAYVNADGHTQMVQNADDEILTPSAVLFEKDETIVGKEARKAREFFPDRIAEWAKRDIGQKYYARPIGGANLPPEVIQGCILRKLSSDVRAVVGDGFKVVITVPAYFDETRRKATADAGEMSGLDVIDIVNEPTAAALAFGERLGYLTTDGAPRDTLNLLVYDLGGGTFDVTIIRLEPGQITTLATDGDVQLGGYDWDSQLLHYVEEQGFSGDPELLPLDARAESSLRKAVEEAKHSLSVRNQTTVQFSHADKSVQAQVTREKFEQLTANLLDRTAFTTRQTLRESKLSWSEIDRVLLVGGSTRMPMVHALIRELSGITPDVNVNPDEAVARGAAIYAAHRLSSLGQCTTTSGISVTDVNSHSLGIDGIDQQTMRKQNAIIIPRNTALPIEITRQFVTKEDDQKNVVIQVLEGESSLPAHCTELGRAVIRNLPSGLPAGTKVDVHYRFGENGRLSVRAHVPGGGDSAQIELQHDRGLSGSNVDQWKNVICKDGGFDDFEMAIQEIMEEEDENDFESRIYRPPTVEQTSIQKSGPEPVIPYGAPKAAADTLKSEFSKKPVPVTNSSDDETIRLRKQIRMAIFVTGHVVASFLGIALGYYILCWIRPSANFLNWDLPGIQKPASVDESTTNNVFQRDNGNTR